ncbi:hypothetical protein, partial [Pseudomonas helleri]|uniref:hypothetical protein n=1 Tax=Pseudomonas helleri TaxID=1608996 RepID=UPI001E55D33B
PVYGPLETCIRTCSNEAVSLDLENSQKKGGRPVQSYAQSFVFSLPPSVVKPTPGEWKSITSDILKELAKKLDIDINDFKGRVFANVHDQDNPHLNLVVSRVVQGKTLKALDQKGTIGVAKKAFNAASLARCGLDVSAYEPLQTNVGPHLAKWQLQQKDSEKALKEIGLKSKAFDNDIAKTKEYGRLSAMLNNQIVKWIFSIGSGDIGNENRQKNRIEKTTEELSKLNISKEQAELLDSMFEMAETKTGKTLENRVRWKI